MVQKILMILLCLLTSSNSHAENKLEGHWLGIDGKSLAEFTDDKIIVTLLKDDEENNTKFTANYEKFDASRFHLKDANEISAVLVIDWKQKTFSIQNLQGDFTILNFIPAPKIAKADILGKWYSSIKEDTYEASFIYTRRDKTYDLDWLDIDHEEKTFTKEIKLNESYAMKNGFTIIETDSKTKEDYIYYITLYEKNTLNYVDANGFQWAEYRKDDAVHIDIPEEYTERKSLSL